MPSPTLDALTRARRHLLAAQECQRSMVRAQHLWLATDALNAAGLRPWADRAESAALRIGGADTDVERLLADVEAMVMRGRTAA